VSRNLAVEVLLEFGRGWESARRLDPDAFDLVVELQSWLGRKKKDERLSPLVLMPARLSGNCGVYFFVPPP
jgi:hypothetical protein